MSEQVFGEFQEYRDWTVLMNAIDEVGETPCMNYPEMWFPEREEGINLWNDAKELCKTCPVMKECRTFGIRWADYGIWGGLTDRQRMKIRAKFGITK